VALRQGPHIKVAVVASRWQRVGDLIGLRFEQHTFRTWSIRLTSSTIGLAMKFTILEQIFAVNVLYKVEAIVARRLPATRAQTKT